jgi:hypothetical protein
MTQNIEKFGVDRFADYNKPELFSPSYTDTSKLSDEEKSILDNALNKSWINPRFKMKYFVAGDHVTPFHQLRQLLIELRSTEEQVEMLEYNMKKYPVEIKIEKLIIENSNSEIDRLQAQLRLEDLENKLVLANRRCQAQYIERHLYLDLIKEFLDSDAGKTETGESLMTVFGTSLEDHYEKQYWTLRLAKQAAMDMLCYGSVTAGNLSAITCLAEDQQNQVFSVAHKYTLEMKEHQEEIRAEMAKQLGLEKMSTVSLEQAQRDQNALENKKTQEKDDGLEDVYNL